MLFTEDYGVLNVRRWAGQVMEHSRESEERSAFWGYRHLC